MKKEITQENALTIYPHLDETGKKTFKELYPEFFMENFSLEEAYKKLGLDSKQEIPYSDSSPKTKRQKKLNTFAKLDILREAIGNHPGINDKKWYPVFNVTSTGLVFARTNDGYWSSYSLALVGAPFVFKTSDEAADFGKSNVDLYTEIFTR